MLLSERYNQSCPVGPEVQKWAHKLCLPSAVHPLHLKPGILTQCADEAIANSTRYLTERVQGVPCIDAKIHWLLCFAAFWSWIKPPAPHKQLYMAVPSWDNVVAWSHAPCAPVGTVPWDSGRSWVQGWDTILESLRLEKTSMITNSKHRPALTMPTDRVPQCHAPMVFEHLQEWWLHLLPGQLCHCITTLSQNKCFLISNLNVGMLVLELTALQPVAQNTENIHECELKAKKKKVKTYIWHRISIYRGTAFPAGLVQHPFLQNHHAEVLGWNHKALMWKRIFHLEWREWLLPRGRNVFDKKYYVFEKRFCFLKMVQSRNFTSTSIFSQIVIFYCFSSTHW